MPESVKSTGVEDASAGDPVRSEPAAGQARDVSEEGMQSTCLTC